MIVALAEVKAALGIDEADETHDVQLTRLINSSTAIIEGTTHRRFDEPISRIEYRCGRNEPNLILAGHIDDSADNPSETPPPVLTIARRSLPPFGSQPWDDLTEGTDWERREDEVISLGVWGIWQETEEYRLTYPDGYLVAPADIQQVLVELVMNQRAIESNVAGGTAGITSESLGDFRYDINFSAVGAGGNTVLSDTAMRTLKRYKRVLV